MSQLFWQHKLRSLLNYHKHPVWQPVCASAKTDQEHFWQQLRCMENFLNPEQVQPSPDNHSELGLIDFWFSQNHDSEVGQTTTLAEVNSPRSPTPISDSIPESILNCIDGQKVFWWFWRCYPEIDRQRQSQPISSWSDCSISSALVGSHLGYPSTNSPSSHNHGLHRQHCYRSRPFLALFSLSSVLDFLHTSRTVQDVWSSEWILNYLLSKICWKLAWKYGPDIFLQPCLYTQPWIDFWLLQHYPDFESWIAKPSREAKLNAHFPNTLMLILPDNGIDSTIAKGNPIWASMIYAEQILKQEWLTLGEQVLAEFAQQHAAWQRIDSRFWEGWLEPHWQPSWMAFPIDNTTYASRISSEAQPSASSTSCFLQQAQQSLHTVQQSRSWKLPTTFSLRSSLSGVGAVVHPICDPHHPEGASTAQIQEFWQHQLPSPYLDTHEALNAVEVLKRGLPQILPKLLGEEPGEFNASDDRQPVFPFIPTIPNPINSWFVLAASQGDRPVGNASDSIEAELTNFAALKRLLLTFSHQLAPEITAHYQGNLLYACDTDVLAQVAFPNWDQWLWHLYESYDEMQQEGQYLQIRPGAIHFGLVIANVATPFPLVLEQVRQAKTAASQYARSIMPSTNQRASVVQVRLLEEQGNTLIATAQWTAFKQWRSVVRQWQQGQSNLNPHELEQFFQTLRQTALPEAYDQEAQNWLQLAVFHLR